MACDINYAKFKGVSNIGETQLLTEIENNLKQYVDWSMLCIGGWTDVIIQTPDVDDGYGGSQETLRWVEDPSYNNGQVWQGFRKDWVYESGINFEVDGTGYDPINIQDSGVSINGTFQTTGYYINYPLGQVIFDNAIVTGSEVKSLCS